MEILYSIFKSLPNIVWEVGNNGAFKKQGNVDTFYLSQTLIPLLW